MNAQEQNPRLGSGWTTALGLLALAWLLAALVLQWGPLRTSAKLARLEAEKQKLAVAEAEACVVRQRAVLTARYLDRSRSVLECWREIAVLLPQGVEITTFAYRAPGELKVTGVSADVARVYDFKKQLDESKLFAGATLAGPRQDAQNRQVFELALALQGGEE